MTREEAIEVLSQRPMIAPSKSNKQKMFEEAIDMAIEALHREEAEEKGYCHRIRPKNVEVVVRCKDCKWHMDDYMGEWCGKLRGHPGMKANDFCSYGERKGGENE